MPPTIPAGSRLPNRPAHSYNRSESLALAEGTGLVYGHTLEENFCAWRPIQTYGRIMLISELLIDRYAPLHDLCQKTVDLYKMTLDRFGEFLTHDPVLTDLDDLVVCKFLRWRATTPHRGRLCSAASVLKDKCQLVAI